MTRSLTGTAAERSPWYSRIAGSRWAHWGLLALVMLFTMRGWLNALLPASPRMEMIVEFTTSWFVLDELKQGRFLTSWNPWEFGGFPWMRLLAWPLYAIMALIAWAGIPMEQALKVLMFLGFAASGVAMYEFARLLAGRWQAGLLAGLIYMLAPFHVHTAVDWWEFVPFWALLPLPFLFYELALRRPEKRTRYLALTALSLGLFPWISPERTLVSAVWFGGYAILREASRAVRRETSWARAAVRLAAVGVCAAVVALAMVLPAALELKDLGAHHMRGSDNGAATVLLADYSASPALLLGALLRRLKIPVDTAALPTIWRSFGSIFAWYLGLPALALAALGLAQIRRYREVWVVALLGAFALWLAFGPTVPLNPFQQLPLFKTLIPFRGLMLVTFSLSILAGFGLLTLERVVRRVPLNAWLALATVVVIADFRPAGDVFTVTESYFTEDEKAAYAFVAEQEGDWRLWEPISQNAVRYVATYALPLAPVSRFVGHWVEGTPIHTWELMDWGDRKTALDILSARYVLLRKGDPEYSLFRSEAEDAGFVVKAWDAPTVEIWENPDHRPFAIIRTAQGSLADGRVEYIRESPTRIRVMAEPVSASTLVVSEAWYPHWRVFVDGEAAPLLRVDEMLQGVELRPGTHDVQFVYQEPLHIPATRILSGLAALSLIVLAALRPKTKISGDRVGRAI